MMIRDNDENRELIASVMGCTLGQADTRTLAIVANLIEELKSGSVYMDRDSHV